MPPLRKKKAPVAASNPVCRVCLAEGGVLVELFGSQTQAVSYAEDVNTCLSYEVCTINVQGICIHTCTLVNNSKSSPVCLLYLLLYLCPFLDI